MRSCLSCVANKANSRKESGGDAQPTKSRSGETNPICGAGRAGDSASVGMQGVTPYGITTNGSRLCETKPIGSGQATGRPRWILRNKAKLGIAGACG
jgi:hypothetical protein